MTTRQFVDESIYVLVNERRDKPDTQTKYFEYPRTMGWATSAIIDGHFYVVVMDTGVLIFYSLINSAMEPKI